MVFPRRVPQTAGDRLPSPVCRPHLVLPLDSRSYQVCSYQNRALFRALFGCPIFPRSSGYPEKNQGRSYYEPPLYLYHCISSVRKLSQAIAGQRSAPENCQQNQLSRTQENRDTFKCVTCLDFFDLCGPFCLTKKPQMTPA